MHISAFDFRVLITCACFLLPQAVLSQESISIEEMRLAFDNLAPLDEADALEQSVGKFLLHFNSSFSPITAYDLISALEKAGLAVEGRTGMPMHGFSVYIYGSRYPDGVFGVSEAVKIQVILEEIARQNNLYSNE